MNKNWNMEYRKTVIHRRPMWIEILTNELARDYIKNNPGERLICFWCGRDKFTSPTPHKCNTGFRKRKLKWYSKKPLI